MRRLLRELSAVVCVLSIAAVLYPPVSESISRWRQEEIMIAAAKQITAAPDEKLTAEYAAAEEYNRCLLSGGQLSSYSDLLNLSGDGIMGVLEIPKIDVTLPIYHGTDNTTLSKGIGHLYGTSLPVGGKGTHAALSGHSGMAGQRMLSDLDQLVIGDCFTLRVLGKNLTYQADQIKIVLPEDVSDLAIDPEKDYVTLVTCTPYGVNTHRLLVRGIRVTEQEMPVYNKAPSTWYRQYGYGILAGLIAAVLLMSIPFFIRHRKRKFPHKMLKLLKTTSIKQGVYASLGVKTA